MGAPVGVIGLVVTYERLSKFWSSWKMSSGRLVSWFVSSSATSDKPNQIARQF